jgi:hypothetical protein
MLHKVDCVSKAFKGAAYCAWLMLEANSRSKVNAGFTFIQITMAVTTPESTQRLNVDSPYFALTSYALHNETTVSQLVRDSLRGIVEYDTWFKAKVQATQADPRPAIAPAEWDAIRTKKLAQC